MTGIQDVNIELGDDVSRMLYEASILTHENRPGLLVEFHESFSGVRAIPGSYLKDPDNLYLQLGFDGTGTKVELPERLKDHTTIAHDLFAMVCDDAVVRGAEPIAIGSILDVRQLNDTDETRIAVRQLAQGYVEAARAAGVVVVNGEVAELGSRINGYRRIDGYGPVRSIGQRLLDRVMHRPDTDFNYNWGAAVLWIAHKDRILTGHQIQPGDALVGLAEPGFRANGITDVRMAMLKRYGRRWHEKVVPGISDDTLGVEVQRPSTIYSQLINDLTGGFDIEREPKAKITGVAHITGGGQPSKLRRMLEPSGHGVIIDDPIEPPDIMLHAQVIRGLTDRQAYGKWHMGPGIVIATPEPEKVLRVANEHDKEAKVIGEVTGRGDIIIRNRGHREDDKWLHFDTAA